MIHEKIYFDKRVPNAYITTYVSELTQTAHDAILVIPGGGYANVCSDREGHPIAMAYAARGINAFVLEYTVKPSDPYLPLTEASLAMKFIKSHAKEYAIDPNRVFVVGFSAGGHLAASLGTMWNDPILADHTGLSNGENKPCGMILCYAVINRSSHPNSLANLLGEHANDETYIHAFALDERVGKDTCPAFFFHTVEDEAVPIDKSALVMASALTKAGISYEAHIYPKGPHGMALANEITRCGCDTWVDQAAARWVDDSVVWMARKPHCNYRV